MDNRTTIILTCICVFFVVVFALNVFKFIIQQNSIVRQQLLIQNKKIIFINSSSLNIKEDCYPTDDFFKMHNTGKDPREQNDLIEYVKYSEKTDYYI